MDKIKFVYLIALIGSLNSSGYIARVSAGKICTHTATCDRGATPRGKEDPFQRSSHATVLDPVEGAHLRAGRPGEYRKHGFPLVGSNVSGLALLPPRSDSPVEGLCRGAVARLNGEDWLEE